MTICNKKGVPMDNKQYEKLLAIVMDKLEQKEIEVTMLKYENNRLQKRLKVNENGGVKNE